MQFNDVTCSVAHFGSNHWSCVRSIDSPSFRSCSYLNSLPAKTVDSHIKRTPCRDSHIKRTPCRAKRTSCRTKRDKSLHSTRDSGLQRTSCRKKRTAGSNALRAGEDGDACVHPLWERSRVRCLCFFPNAAGMSCLRQTYVLEHFSTVPIFLKVSRGTCRCWFGRHCTPHERNRHRRLPQQDSGVICC